ncbi:hypothetical protein PInf_009561 [Phytophthora infestans]|nr:hypothetical protein PInf_009561 [Phytophthora infestans]
MTSEITLGRHSLQLGGQRADLIESASTQERISSTKAGGDDGDLGEGATTGDFPYTNGKVDDVMLGILSPTLEAARTKTSFIDDRSGSALLSLAKVPTADEPFQSVVVNWMELDIRRRSMGIVKNGFPSIRGDDAVEVTSYFELSATG